MATWKKLATMQGDSVVGSITGIAYGGLGETLSITGGGTGADMTNFPTGSLLMYDGTQVVPVENTGANNEILISDGSGWTFRDVADTHEHSQYVGVSGDSVIDGSLTVAGSVQADSMEIIELNTIDQATGTGVVLNTSGGSANGDQSGLFNSLDGDSTISNNDPAILWNHTESSWYIGKWSSAGDNFSSMKQLGEVEILSSAPTGSADKAGVLASHGGNVYVSVA
jgi:hypothetical protein